MNNSFGKNIIPGNEAERIKALESYNVLYDLPDRYFSNLAHIIAASFGTPVALITLVKSERVIFKGNVGMEGTNSADRGVSLCSLAILDNNVTVFGDALDEPCLLSNPNVVGEFGLRFYAASPITTPGGFNIGTVCVIDKAPRAFTIKEQELLQRFAENVMHELEKRKSMHSIEQAKNRN